MASHEDKTEKIQVLLSSEDLEDLSKKISKRAIQTGNPPESISHYVRRLIRKNLGKPTND